MSSQKDQDWCKPSISGHDPGALLREILDSGISAADWKPMSPAELSWQISGYEVTELIGWGGMGAVYRGVQTALEREVAIKLLSTVLRENPEFEVRFTREAKSLAKLNHPNIVQIHDFGQTADGNFFFAMEYVDGVDLLTYSQDCLFDQEAALKVISQICDALEFAHNQGLVHRDIKPANIFLNQSGIIKVGDFGLAKLIESNAALSAKRQSGLTMTGRVIGTPHYSSPEQIRNELVDVRADIYSVGVMLYEILTGEIPRGTVRPPSEIAPSTFRETDQLVFRAMEVDPANRYQTMEELKSDLAAIQQLKVSKYSAHSRSSTARLSHEEKIGTNEASSASLSEANDTTSKRAIEHIQSRKAEFLRGALIGVIAMFVASFATWLIVSNIAKNRPIQRLRSTEPTILGPNQEALRDDWLLRKQEGARLNLWAMVDGKINDPANLPVDLQEDVWVSHGTGNSGGKFYGKDVHGNLHVWQMDYNKNQWVKVEPNPVAVSYDFALIDEFGELTWEGETMGKVEGKPPFCIATIKDKGWFVSAATEEVTFVSNGSYRPMKFGAGLPPDGWFKGAVKTAYFDKYIYRLTADGILQGWNIENARITEPKPDFGKIIDIAVSDKGIIFLTEYGTVSSIGGLPPPWGFDPAVAIRAGGQVAACQMVDGSWKSWGGDQPEMCRRINNIRNAIDISFYTSTGDHILVWME